MVASAPDLPVSERLASQVRNAIALELGHSIRGVRTEIQDGGLFLFVEAELSQPITSETAKNLCEAGARVLGSLVPSRSNDYSWILNLTQNSEIVRSESGGWEELR